MSGMAEYAKAKLEQLDALEAAGFDADMIQREREAWQLVVSQGPTDTPVSPDPLTTGWMGAHYRAIQRQRAEKDS